jgi:amino acid transporter/nucleotide-binding universal stress UspA family protein
MNLAETPEEALGNGEHFPTKVTLSRSLSLFTITMIGVGGMIGAGIFVLTGIAAGVAGPALVLAFLLNGLIALLTGMVYAELGSAFPEAGGGYLWVKEGLGGSQGFLAGWMSWFAHVVAGSLYALGFGRFAAELWVMAGLPTFGMPENDFIRVFTLIMMTAAIAFFTTLNYRGASETGTVGNIVTVTKISILGLFALFGILAMLRMPHWSAHFTDDFLPNGFAGLLQAMGLTFIAFEGYEIIAQSGEEVINPKRNVPRAIFLAIGIAISLYLLISFVSLGATTPPLGLKVYEYLGQMKEIATVEVAQQVFPWGIGGVVLIFSGLVATMSALNATTYSSSRVSFAMGRDRNLPLFFSRIHPARHTPYLAVLASGGLMLVMAWSLPIEQVAAAADLMFLFLFLQVNLAILRLRRKMPDMESGYRVPYFPAIPIVALLANALLAAFLFTYSPRAWYIAAGWVIVGLLAYYVVFSKREALERPAAIMAEEVLVSREYSVLVPVANAEQARIMGLIGAILAEAHGGEVLALHVPKVPVQLGLADGRLMLRDARALFEIVIAQAKPLDVPVHTVVRLGRNVADAVQQTALENASNLVVLGWPGHSGTPGLRFGRVIDPLVDNPPTDVLVVRYRSRRPLRRILIPVAGGRNSRLAVKMAVNMAGLGENGPVKLTLLNIVPEGAGLAGQVRAKQFLDEAALGLPVAGFEQRIVEGRDVVGAILEQAEGHDLIVIGASGEPLFRNLLMGSIPEQVAEKAQVTVVMVKSRSSRLHSFLRQTVLEPTTSSASAGPAAVAPASGHIVTGSPERAGAHVEE